MSKFSMRILSLVTTVGLVTTLLVALAAPATGGSHPFTVSLFVNGDTTVPCEGQIGDCKLNIHQSTPGATMTFTVWETSAKSNLLETIVIPNHTGDFVFVGGGGFDPGNWVEVSDGTDTRSAEIPVHMVAIDFETNIVSGHADPAGEMAVNAHSKDGTEVCGRNITPDSGGDWATDLDTAQNDGGSATCSPTHNFGPGDWVQVANNGIIDFGDIQTVRQVPDFSDDDGSIFESDITWLATSGITKGCNPPANDQFCPNDPVTRGQMAAFLVRALGLTDDDGSIFEGAIAKLAAAGITQGCNPPDNTQFCPTDDVTRGQMAAFLVRALGLTDGGGGNNFTDDDGSIFEGAIAKLAAAGITAGCNPPDNTEFCPNDKVTRGQMAAFLRRALG